MLFSGGYKVCLDNLQPLTAIFLDFVSLITIFLFVLHIALSHTLFFCDNSTATENSFNSPSTSQA